MKLLKTYLITFVVLMITANSGFAVEYFLRADVTTTTMPDGTIIPMWGFAMDSAFGAADGNVVVPGPMLTVPSADTQLIVHLDNNLTVPVSLIIDGQAAAMTPVRDPNGRMYSMTHEAEPNNAVAVDYIWPTFRDGSYIYHSGSHMAVQVQMGLYGGVTKDFDVNEIYSGVPYDISVPLFYSEIDPALHIAVATDSYGPGKSMTSTIDYEPTYYLINGQPFVLGNSIIPVGDPGDTVLLRLFNMSLKTRCPLLLQNNMTLIAEDGFPYTYPKEEYVAFLAAGKTMDALATFSADGVYPVLDRRLGLANAPSSGPLPYQLQFRYALGSGNRPLRITVNGVEVAAALAFPATGSWTTWSTVSLNASLRNGDNIIRATTIGSSGANVDSLSLVSTGTGSTPPIAEAEDATLSGAVASSVVNGYTGTGFADYANLSGDYIEWTVNVSGPITVPTLGGMLSHLVVGIQNLAPTIASVTATPAIIDENQTSQLQVNVNASLPLPLTYSWIVPVGAGSVSDPNIANPVYTPPDVALQQIFTLTVQVSDGMTTISDTVDITVNPIVNIFEAEDAVLSGPLASSVMSGYTGTGFADYVNASTDYIEWTVNAVAATSYQLDFRYALASGNRPLQISVNGSVAVASLAFPATGSWTTWSAVSTTVTLNTGVNTIRATAIGSSGANIDNLTVTAVVAYEAEDAVLSGPLASSAVSGYTGTGFADYVNASTDYVEWTVNAAAGGSYQLDFRYALASGNRPLQISVNGSVAVASLAFPATGSWTTWSTVSTTVTLNAGANTIRATAIGSSGANIDYLNVISQ